MVGLRPPEMTRAALSEPDADGTIAGCTGSGIDVTNRNRAAGSWRTAAAAPEAISEGIVIADFVKPELERVKSERDAKLTFCKS